MVSPEILDYNPEMLRLAIQRAVSNIPLGGGPFGAVITDKDGNILASAGNTVTLDNDPTAHAEINAIRKACKKVGSFKLEGCTLYASCQPCPMCFGAIYWAGISRVFYAASSEDAARIEFDDAMIYRELECPDALRSIDFCQDLREEAQEPFKLWEETQDKIKY